MSEGCACLACRVERAIIDEIQIDDDGTGEFDPHLVIAGCARVLAGLAAEAENATPGGGWPLLLTIAPALSRRYRAARQHHAAGGTAH